MSCLQNISLLYYCLANKNSTVIAALKAHILIRFSYFYNMQNEQQPVLSSLIQGFQTNQRSFLGQVTSNAFFVFFKTLTNTFIYMTTHFGHKNMRPKIAK